MVWQTGVNNGFNESDNIAHLIVPYTRGHVLELGSGTNKCWPHFTSVDSCQDIISGGVPIKHENVDVCLDCSNLSLFADESWDSIFSSHLLEHFDREKVPAILADWARVLRPGGYLVLYIPSANLYPKAGTAGANMHHKWDIYPGDVEKILREATSCGWTQLEKEERNGGTEYSLYLAFRKRDDGKWVENIFERNPDGKKRCLVIRFGAIGDLIQTTALMPELKKQGYHVTWMLHAATSGVVMNNPNVDEWWLQDQDQVPNNQLGPFWTSLQERYDHIINLCESIEGGLLAMPGKLQHSYSQESRQRLYGTVNYYDRMCDIAAIPYGVKPKFYPTEEEKKWANNEKMKYNAPIVVWCLTGTSFHKTYPFIDSVLKMLLAKTPAQIYLYGDKNVARDLQNAILHCLIKDGVDVGRISGICGHWGIRESLAFAMVADVVVGPETGVINAVGFEEQVEKVIYLSHSSHTNLTRDWINTTVVTPGKSECPCYPCHRLHYDWSFCHKVEDTGSSLCTSTIKPETISKAVITALLRKAKLLGN